MSALALWCVLSLLAGVVIGRAIERGHGRELELPPIKRRPVLVTVKAGGGHRGPGATIGPLTSQAYDPEAR